MRKPFDLSVIGKNLATVKNWNADNLKAGGSYAGQGPVDATPRLYVRRDGDGPLYVVVGKPTEAIFRMWQREAIRIGAIMLGLIVFVLGATLSLAREIERRAAAEEKLKELATTDSLTGLKNRRKFDAEIDTEWRRAARQKTPLALLMIDADHFKAYNDTYGHQAGDQVLVVSRSAFPIRCGAPAIAPRVMAARNLPCCCRNQCRRGAEGGGDDPVESRAMVGGADGQHRKRRRCQPDADSWDGLVAAGGSRRQGALRSESRRA